VTFIRIIAIMLAANLATPVLAGQNDPRAKDAIDLFKSFCVSTQGVHDRAVAAIGSGNALANPLPANAAEALLHQPGAVAWAIRSPADAKLMLGYGGEGHCEIRINEADEASVLAQYEQLAASYPDSSSSDIFEPKVRNELGVKRTFRGFGIRNGTFLAAVGLTTSDKAGGEQQHLITYDVQSK
jgi:hypothetical protein